MEAVKIKDIFSIIRNGANIKQSSDKTGYPITRIETIVNNQIDYSRVGFADVFDEKYSDYYLSNGDILMSHINSVTHLGKVGIVEDLNTKVIHGMNLIVLKSDIEIAYPKYLYRYFITKTFRNKLIPITKKSVNQASFNISDLKKIEIPLPPYADQISIANVLGKIEDVIQARKNAIDQLDELVKATFYDMFGDPVKINKKEFVTIDDVSTQVTDGEHSTPIRTESGIKLLSARNVQNGYLDFSKGVDYVGEEEYARIIKRAKPEVNDILMSCSGSIGRIAVITIDEPLTLVRSVALIKPKKELLNSFYFMHWLQTDFLQFEIQKNSKKSSQANIFTGAIKKLPVYIPDFNLQNQFASIAQKIEKLKDEQAKQLLEMEALYASLSHAAFSGDLDLSRIPYDDSLLPVVETEIEPVVIDKKKEEYKEIENKTPLQLNGLNGKRTKHVLSSTNEWSKLSFKKIAELITNHFQANYFNSEMLLRYLTEDAKITVDYFSSKEQKLNLKLENANDFLVFLTDAVNGKNPYLKLEQVFYNAEIENIKDITFTSKDLETLSKKTPQERSGIYFCIKNETTTR